MKRPFASVPIDSKTPNKSLRSAGAPRPFRAGCFILAATRARGVLQARRHRHTKFCDQGAAAIVANER